MHKQGILNHIHPHKLFFRSFFLHVKHRASANISIVRKCTSRKRHCVHFFNENFIPIYFNGLIRSLKWWFRFWQQQKLNRNVVQHGCGRLDGSGERITIVNLFEIKKKCILFLTFHEYQGLWPVFQRRWSSECFIFLLFIFSLLVFACILILFLWSTISLLWINIDCMQNPSLIYKCVCDHLYQISVWIFI